ncbi:carboxylating nicotinate-nucleotide diphosphorylase [Dethiothermospora halolimnae]|uniref:carboxylating nicotinate-nucleotide diphosphorylase n=1 Tax=Dethiothermospora halolimnae TaxID=3114390 RepID=UPI003CCBBD20
MIDFKIQELIKNALIEDMNNGDITTDNLIDDDHISKGEILAKEEGVIAGLNFTETTFKLLDDGLEFIKLINDGDKVKKGDIIAKVAGKTKAILSGERTALNILQRMSAIATKASIYKESVNEYDVKIVDTRKTTPLLREMEKYAVKIGGGHNHRFNLSDAVMIKDNHIKASGGITKAIEKIKDKLGHTIKIEVEVESLGQLEEAIRAGADIIMLDNMTIEDMKKAVNINSKRTILEASGNITIDRIKSVAKTGVDVISVGALTHSVKALDISLNIV